MPDQRSRTTASRNITFLVVFLAIMALGRDRMFRDPGTLWHTVVGTRMLQTGEIIRKDWFSFSQPGYPWIAQQWLGECLMAAMHKVAGLDGLLLLSAAMIATLFAFLAARFSQREDQARFTLPGPVLAVFLLLLFAACSYHFIPRPHLATILLMAWIHAILCDVESRRRTAMSLFVLPLILILWTNVHGGALGGLVTILAVILGWLILGSSGSSWWQAVEPRGASDSPGGSIRRVADGEAPPGRQLSTITLGCVAVACIASVLFNPYGPQLPATWLRLMDSRVLPKLIVEHAPLRVFSIEGIMLLSLAAVYVGVLASTWRAHRRLTTLIPLLWLALALSRVRHGPLFAVTAAVAIAEMLPFLASSPIWKRVSSRFKTTNHGRPHGSDSDSLLTHREAGTPGVFRWNPLQFFTQSRWLPAAVVMVALLLQSSGLRLPILGAGWTRLNPNYWPVAATIALRDQASPVGGLRVFNDMRYGGYLTYYAPETKVFIDDRCEFYGDWFLETYAGLRRRPEQLNAYIEAYGINAVMVGANSPVRRHFDRCRDWTRVFSDETAAVFLKAGRRQISL